MAVAIAKVAGGDHVAGNKRRLPRDLTFSGNYATGGETVLPATVGLKTIEQVVHNGVAISSDVATALGVAYNHATSKFVFYEGSAAGTALSEKTNAEAYPTGLKLRCTFVGF